MENRLPITHVVLVGHCGYDAQRLAEAVEQALPGLAVEMVDSAAELADHAGPQALWLVNRVLEGDFDHESGIALIRDMAERADPPLMMLISDRAEAQEAAVAAGALRGFGKQDLNSRQVRQILRRAVGWKD